MESAVTQLIATLQKTIRFLEVRAGTASGEYLEAVLSRPDLQRCYTLLGDTLGPAVKEFSQAATFERDVRTLVDRIGGVRVDQCLFLKVIDPQQTAYAALWPWASDATRVTLKVGVLRQ